MDIAHALTTESWSSTFERLLDTFDRLARAEPIWLLRLMAYQVCDALDALEESLPSGAPDAEPASVETHLYPLEHHWARTPATASANLSRIPKELNTLLARLQELLERCEPALLDAKTSPFARFPDLRRFPHDLLAILTLLPEEELRAISAYLYRPAPGAATGRPRAVRADEVPDDEPDDEMLGGESLSSPRHYEDIAHLAFDENVLVGTVHVQVVARFYPLMLDLETRQIFYPSLVGIQVVDPIEQNPAVTDPAFWSTLRAQVGERILSLSTVEAGHARAGDRAFPAASGPPPPGMVVPQTIIRPPFYVAFGPAPQSDLARQIVNAAYPIQLPSSWSTLKPWRELKENEVNRILKSEGEESKKLKRQYRPDGSIVYDLKADVERDLKLRSSLRSGYIDLDEFEREFLVRNFEVGSGYLEIGLSWHGMAGPFITEWLEQTKARLHPPGVKQMRFDELSEETQGKVDRLLSQIRIWENGRRVMEMILGQVGRQRRNPVEIPAEAFRVLLWPSLARSRAWPRNWKRDVEGILEGLRAVSFRYHAHRTPDIKGKGMGSFIGEWSYVPRGKGRHGNGVYVIDVQRGFLGCLYVFISDKTRLRSGREAFTFDYEKELSKEERLALGWGEGNETVDTYTISDASRPFVTAALEFTPQQENLLRWLDQEMTRQRDPACSGNLVQRLPAGHKDAQRLRGYGWEFCPLIPEGKSYAGALGHFTRNPEVGFTLYGTRRQRRYQGHGLLATLGYSMPRGRAHRRRAEVIARVLDDLRAVVESHLDGLVACFHEGQWLALDGLDGLPELELLHNVRFFCFVPLDYNTRLIEKWEATTGYGAVNDAGEAERHYWNASSGELSETSPLVTRGIDPQLLHGALQDAMQQRTLRQKDLADIFGVSSATISYWLKGTEPDEEGKVRGRPIPEEMVPFVIRWIEYEETPTEEELAGLKSRRPGVRTTQDE